MKKITVKSCPFCKEELEIVGKGHYFAHKTNNGCILQHLCFEIDDEEAVAAWNNRKPVDDVLERMEEEYKAAADDMKRCSRENPLQFDSAKGYARGILNAIEIIKEELVGE